jgi:putative ABC transport system permease protein
MFFRLLKRHIQSNPILFCGNLLGLATAVALIFSVTVANDKALYVLKTQSEQPLLFQKEEGLRRLQWRVPNGYLSPKDLSKCFRYIPKGVMCEGVASRNKTLESNQVVRLVGIDGSLITLSSPIASNLLGQEGDRLFFQDGKEWKIQTSYEDREKVLVLDFHQLAQWLDLSGYDWIEISERKKNLFSDKQWRQIVSDIESEFQHEAVRSTPEAAYQNNRELTSSYRVNLQAIGFISILVGFLLIWNIATLQITLRKPKIEVLRKLGASRNQVLTLLFKEQILTGMLGGFLGIFLGLLFERVVSVQMLKTMSQLYLDISYGSLEQSLALSYWLPFIFLSIIINLLASSKEIFELSRAEPSSISTEDTHRQDSSAFLPVFMSSMIVVFIFMSSELPALHFQALDFISGKQPIFGYVAALLTFFLPFLLAPILSACFSRLALWLQKLSLSGREKFPVFSYFSLRKSFSNRVANRPAVATLACGLSMVLGIHLFVSSFEKNLIQWIQLTFQAELAGLPTKVYGLEKKPRLLEQDLDRLQKLYPERDNVDCVLLGYSEFDERPIRVGGISDALPDKYEPPVRFLSKVDGMSDKEVLERIMKDPEAIIVSEPFYTRFGLSTGGRLSLKFSPTSKDRNLKILGVFQSYSTELGLVLTGRDTISQDFGFDGCHNFRIYTFDDSAKEAILRLKEKYPDLEKRATINPSVNVLENALSTFRQTFSVTQLMTLLAGILGTIALFIQILQTMVNRQHEWLTLRKIGFSQKSIARIISYEVLFSIFTGSAMGLFGGLLFSWILSQSINLQAFGWSIDFVSSGFFFQTVLKTMAIMFLLWILSSGLTFLTVSRKLESILHEGGKSE